MVEKMVGERLLPDFASRLSKNASLLRDEIKRKRVRSGRRAYWILEKTTRAIISQLFSTVGSRTQHYGLGYQATFSFPERSEFGGINEKDRFLQKKPGYFTRMSTWRTYRVPAVSPLQMLMFPQTSLSPLLRTPLDSALAISGCLLILIIISMLRAPKST